MTNKQTAKVEKTVNSTMETTNTRSLPKRLIIKKVIAKGGATKEDLMKAANVSVKSLASNFSYLRLMGYYPYVKSDGTYGFMTEQEWRKMKADRAAKTKQPVKPEKQLEKLQAKIAKLQDRINGFDNTKASDIARLEHNVNKATLALCNAKAAELQQQIESKPN
jgi:hypothetical protein